MLSSSSGLLAQSTQDMDCINGTAETGSELKMPRRHPEDPSPSGVLLKDGQVLQDLHKIGLVVALGVS